MPVVDPGTAGRIARQWLHAWNAHDAAGVVEHFAADVEASSPLIELRRPGSGGRLRGRDEVLGFYEEGLRLLPNLHFEIVDVLRGIDEITIVYRNQARALVAETLTLGAGGAVVAVQVSYGEPPGG
jgi:hypothetical protein